MPGVRALPSPTSPEGQVPQRIRRPSCGSAPIPVTRRGWRPTRGERVAAGCRARRSGGSAGRGGAQPLRRHAAVPDEGARRRRTAVAAGPPERRAGRRGLRAGGPARHSGVLADPQLPRPQPQAGTAGGAGHLRGARRVPARREIGRIDAGAGGFRPGPVRRTCWPASPTPTVCARCSPPGSPRRNRISTCWCPP